MPRVARSAKGGLIYHVFNRAMEGKKLFRRNKDYAAFVEILIAGTDHAAVEVFGFCLMPKHWHLILRPSGDKDLAAYMSWVANTHAKRHQSRYPRSKGHLYRGRYESFAVEAGDDFIDLLRYIESIALRAGLVKRAEKWEWASLSCSKKVARKLLSNWPVDRPKGWRKLVNKPMDRKELARLNISLKRGRPLGRDSWVARMAQKMRIEHTLRPIGRPRKQVRG